MYTEEIIDKTTAFLTLVPYMDTEYIYNLREILRLELKQRSRKNKQEEMITNLTKQPVKQENENG